MYLSKIDVMKKVLLFVLAFCMLGGMWSCSEEETTDTPSVEELQQQINELRAQLEQRITEVNFEGSYMLLTFADGTTLRTQAPESVIPTIGENGNWWVNGKDLGVQAVAEVPVIGENGNWWVDGKDSGVSAAGIVCHGALSRCAARGPLCRHVAGGVSVSVVLHI